MVKYTHAQSLPRVPVSNGYLVLIISPRTLAPPWPQALDVAWTAFTPYLARSICAPYLYKLHTTCADQRNPSVSILRVCMYGTWDMFHLWLISATGSVATEHPHPINAIFTESGCSRISSKNTSRDFPRLHYIRWSTKSASHPVNEYQCNSWPSSSEAYRM